MIALALSLVLWIVIVFAVVVGMNIIFFGAFAVLAVRVVLDVVEVVSYRGDK